MLKSESLENLGLTQEDSQNSEYQASGEELQGVRIPKSLDICKLVGDGPGFPRRPSPGLHRESSNSSEGSRLSLGVKRALLPEVVKFDEFEADFGKIGGWHPDDHAEFVRLLNAAKGNFERCTGTAAGHLFHIEPEKIAMHARWYAQHLDLLAKKKAGIREWRKQKVDQKRAEQQAQSLAKNKADGKQEQHIMARKARKEDIAEWKAARAREREAKAVLKAAQQQAAAAAEAAAWEAKQTIVRAEAEAYKERKALQRREVEERELAETARAKQHMAPTQEQIRASQHRNEEHLRRRAALLAAREKQKAEEEARLEALQRKAAITVDAKAEANPDRLLAPTKAHNQRMAASGPGAVRHESINIRNVQRRASAAWMRGVL